MKKSYELMMILNPTANFESEKKREETVKKLVGDGVTIESLTLLGKKPLAYPIDKETQGIYLVAKLCGNSLKVAQLEKKRVLGKEVLRFLLTLKG